MVDAAAAADAPAVAGSAESGEWPTWILLFIFFFSITDFYIKNCNPRS